jgi:hypothetical protein
MNAEYPLSKKGYKCLDHCYYPNTFIIHPVTLTKMQIKNTSFCPINEINDDGNLILYDKCDKPTHKEYDDTNAPQSLSFNTKLFLKIYGINNFTEGLEWLKNSSHLPIRTLIRNVNCMLSIYGDKNILFSEPIITFIQKLVKKKISYKQVEKYLIKYIKTNKEFDILKIKKYIKKSLNKI